MKRALAVTGSLFLACSAFAGFRVKLIKPKPAERFQTRISVGAVTYAADLVIADKEQKAYFYKELTPAHVIAVRLAVFNDGNREVSLPIDRLQLLDPSGNEVPLVAPQAVAEAVMKGLVVTAEGPDRGSVGVVPRLDPRLDPNDPRYRRYPPGDPRTADPRLDPGDPRYDPNAPRVSRYPNGPYIRSGVDIVLIPGTGGGGDMSQHERALVEKDFADKAHSLEPVAASSARDRFLFFTFREKPTAAKGFILRLPQAEGAPQEILLKFQ